MSLSPILCKLPVWCRIEAAHRRFYIWPERIVARKENTRREKIRELLQMANIGSINDIQNLFKETIAEFTENGLEAELDNISWATAKIPLQEQRHGQQPQRPQL